MKYGYVRVSTISQNIDRQMEEMYKYDLDKKHIYIDKQSGKDFERPEFKRNETIVPDRSACKVCGSIQKLW